MSYIVNCEDIPDGSDDKNLSDDDDEYHPPNYDNDPLDLNTSEDGEIEVVQNEPSTSRKKSEPKYTWVPENFENKENDNAFLGDAELTPALKTLRTTVQIFEYFFTEEMIEFIVSESNRYAAQSSMDFEPISQTISCNHFEEIKLHIHFESNDHILQPSNPGYDKFQKIRPFLTMLRTMLKSIPKEEYLAVDKQITPTKTRKTSLRQYNPKKPHHRTSKSSD